MAFWWPEVQILSTRPVVSFGQTPAVPVCSPLPPLRLTLHFGVNVRDSNVLAVAWKTPHSARKYATEYSSITPCIPRVGAGGTLYGRDFLRPEGATLTGSGKLRC